jgi:hypothetical protein
VCSLGKVEAVTDFEVAAKIIGVLGSTRFNTF